MSDNRSWSGIGEEIRAAVEMALHTGNFKDLGDTVVSTVSDTVKDVSAKIGRVVSGNAGENYTEQWASATRERKQAQEKQQRELRMRQEEYIRRQAPFKRIGRISGILYQVFGGIGVGVLGILSAIFGGIGAFFGGGFLVTFWVFVVCLAIPAAMLHTGIKKRRRLKRAEKYLELSGHNHYINLEDLALLTNKSRKYIRKDIKKMLALGYFPEGHLDAKETCLMLDDKIYREYLDLEKQRRIQEREQRALEAKGAVEKGRVEEPVAEKTAKNSELEAMIAEGQECIRQLRNMNDNIPGEEISAKLFRLENLLKDIFEGLREHPEQLPQMKKFMNYYLPTTLKLVGAYEEFESHDTRGEDVMEAKEEIEKTLDTINSAFEELLNRMFRERAFDVTTDAQVLQTMLAKEGLTKQREFETVSR